MNLTDYCLFITAVNFMIIFYHNKLILLGAPMDYPDNKRKKHKNPVLVSGGMVLIINLLLIFLIDFETLRVLEIFGNNTSTYIYLFMIVGVFFIGFIDDKKNISPLKKLFSIAVLFFIFLNYNDDYVIRNVNFSFIEKSFSLNNLSIPITILCYLLFFNALNMFDGINLQSLLYCASIFIFFILQNINYYFFIVLLIPIIFLIYLNFTNKSFLGDGGCFLLAFIIGTTFVYNYNITGKINYVDDVFVLMILPGVDMFRLFLVRIYNKENPLKPDLNHIHHILNRIFGFVKTTLFIFLINSFCIISVIYNLNTILITTIFLMIYIYIFFKSNIIIK